LTGALDLPERLPQKVRGDDEDEDNGSGQDKRPLRSAVTARFLKNVRSSGKIRILISSLACNGIICRLIVQYTEVLVLPSQKLSCCKF
jgi:hypothetical protein